MNGNYLAPVARKEVMTGFDSFDWLMHLPDLNPLRTSVTPCNVASTPIMLQNML